MKKKNGFTLIELLAVIIILGILMIIAIPSVTKYISDSRKNAYVDTAKEIISGARNLVNGGKLGMYDTNTTYYIPSNCINTENASKSPYGEFTKAYVGIIYDGKGYKYYWISVDDAGQGISKITPLDKLDIDDIESDLTDSDIENVVQQKGIGERSAIKILNCSTNTWDREYQIDDVSSNVSEDGTTVEDKPICIRATVLHTANCVNTYSGCNMSSNHSEGDVLTYGNLGTNGNNPQLGDAFDCDVNADGIYNSQNERFYYIKSDNDKSILIYYSNITNDGITVAPTTDGGLGYATRQAAIDLGYECTATYGCNHYGPIVAYHKLPSKEQWKNKKLILPGIRTILNEDGEPTVDSGAINTVDFNYEDKVARFLSFKDVSYEVLSGGRLYYYNFFLENIPKYENDGTGWGYWTENPCSSNNNWTYFVSGYYGYATINGSYAEHGVRPVITVKTKDISY